jgi:hypothetical protein
MGSFLILKQVGKFVTTVVSSAKFVSFEEWHSLKRAVKCLPNESEI